MRTELIKYAKLLKESGLVSEGCNRGSISVRIDEDTFIMVPSKVSYDSLDENKLNVLKIDGSILEQNAAISRDVNFHKKIYEVRNDARCIIHTHSKYATALAFAGKPIPFIALGMKFHFDGDVRIADFYLPTNPKTDEEIVEKLSKRKAVLIKNHGVVCIGDDPKDAFENTQYLEDLSESYLHAILLGQINTIKLEEE